MLIRYGAVMLAALALLQDAHGVEGPAPAPAPAPSIRWRENLKAARAEIKGSEKLLLMYFGGERCPWCARMEKETFGNDKVVAALAAMIPVKMTGQDARIHAGRFGLRGVPATIFLAPDGGYLHRVMGFRPPADFMTAINAASKAQAAYVETKAGVKANPKNIDAVLKLAEAELSRQSMGEAVKWYRAARQLDRAGSRASAIDLGEAIVLAETGKAAEGEKLLKGILEKHPDSKEVPKTLFVLGVLHARAGRREDALKLFRKLADEHKQSPWARNAARAVQMLSGDRGATR